MMSYDYYFMVLCCEEFNKLIEDTMMKFKS